MLGRSGWNLLWFWDLVIWKGQIHCMSRDYYLGETTPLWWFSRLKTLMLVCVLDWFLSHYHNIDLVVKASSLTAEDLRFDSHLHREDFSGSSHTSDLKIGAPVATLHGAQHYRVSAGISWPIFSILWLLEVEKWSATKVWSAASISVWWLVNLSELACCWDVKQPTNKQTIFHIRYGSRYH